MSYIQITSKRAFFSVTIMAQVYDLFLKNNTVY